MVDHRFARGISFMPAILVILAMPVFIIVWIMRYVTQIRARQREAQLWDDIRKIRRDQQVARPLREYVEQRSLREQLKIPLRLQTASKSPPTLGNIGRFAALSIREHVEEYYVRDDQGQIYGPADEEIIHQWIREERIFAATLLSSNAQGPWMPAKKIRALQDVFETRIQNGANRFDNLKIG